MSDDNKRNPRKRKVPLYRVGKGRPPVETRFKKGTSGNPSGKRKRPRDPWEAMEELLANRTCAVTIENERRRVSLGEALMMSLSNDAMRGKPAAVKIVMDLWMGAANRSNRQRDDELSPADEEVLKALGVPEIGQNPTENLGGDIEITIDPKGTVSINAEEIDDDLVCRIEEEIAEAVAAGEDPVEVIVALLSSMRHDQPSKDGAVAVAETVTSILKKGDGTVEIRSS
jgi:hypothetical protein